MRIENMESFALHGLMRIGLHVNEIIRLIFIF